MRKITRTIASHIRKRLGGTKEKKSASNEKFPPGSQVHHLKPGEPVFPFQNSRAQLEPTLQYLTSSMVWSWGCFRGVLICLARMGQGYYIPASRRPDCVHLDGLQTTFTELRHLSAQRQGRETSRIILVDRHRACLVISGKTHIGSLDKVKIGTAKEIGREFAQIPILSIHVHPGIGDNPGLSDQDYISFLSDRHLIIMMVCFQGGNLFAMKTSATPASFAPDTSRARINVIRNDIHRIWSNMSLPKPILAFNKTVCMEFGLTLYQTEDQQQNVARRIEVTEA